MRLNVNPNRMELSKLKKRLAVARRGYKLLKDKQDGLIQKYVELVKKNKTMREQVEKEIIEALKEFLMARAEMSSKAIEEALMVPAQKVNIDLKLNNLMGVNIPKLDINVQYLYSGSDIPYGYAMTSPELDGAISVLNGLLPRLLELAEIEKTCQLLSSEIEKTRRRVNALEYIMIPQIDETIKYITVKLDENERGNTVRLMKIK